MQFPSTRSFTYRVGIIPFMIALLFAGCSPKEHEAIVATIGSEKITLADYEKLYNSSSTHEAGSVATQQERERFLDLMVDYRLKLADARRDGLDRKPEILNEIEQYRGSLAQSFLTEREVVAPGVRRLYDDGNTETRASHILISLRRDSSPADSETAYRKAYDIIKRLKEGGDFGTLAAELSQDPSARENRGDLYYFTAGQMVRPFEEAAIALKPGEYTTTPVRTQFGLHIIKVTDRRPAPGEVKCSHIMIRFNAKAPTPQDTLAAYSKIRTIQDSLAMGIDFADLAKRNSGDLGSASRGGDLGWFTRRRWVQPFDEVAMALQPGQLSRIVRTVYGYHLIKCYDRRPRKTFDEAKAEVQKQYQQTRFQDEYNTYVDGLKKQVMYTRDPLVVTRFIAACDSTKSIRDSAWNAGITPELGSSAMVTLAGKPVSVDSIVTLLKARPDLAETSLRAATLLPALDKVCEQLMFAARSVTLERENKEFADILTEYRNGLLIYQIEQERVWNKLQPVDSVLHVFYEGHKDKFVFPDRLNISQIRSVTDAQAKAVAALLGKGRTLEQVADADSARMAQPTGYALAFSAGSTRLSPKTTSLLASVAAELKDQTTEMARLTARVDTSGTKQKNERLASSRLDALKAYLTKKLHVPAERISVSTQRIAATAPGAGGNSAADITSRIDIEITGRQALVSGRVETSFVAVNSDDRAKRADSLTLGGTTAPFYFNGGYLIVRLNGREPSRTKTFEEAGAEVSSAYQESESKRLEAEWLGGLRMASPVIEHKEVLKDAFAPEHK